MILRQYFWFARKLLQQELFFLFAAEKLTERGDLI